MSPLFPEEKRAIAVAYARLRAAIETDSADVVAAFQDLQHIYHGAARTFVAQFSSVAPADRVRWLDQVKAYLSEELWPTKPSPVFMSCPNCESEVEGVVGRQPNAPALRGYGFRCAKCGNAWYESADDVELV